MPDIPKKIDVAVVGGGPAGMSAALWCADLGLTAVVFEREAELGGQLLWTFNSINNYLGVEAKNGRDLRDRFQKHIEHYRIEYKTDVAVGRVDLQNRTLWTEDDSKYSARAIIIATGVRRRKLDIPGEEEFRCRGVLVSGARSSSEMTGKTVAVIGGGDAALENALILGEFANEVLVIHRRNEFTARKVFLDQAKKRVNIKFIPDSIVTKILGSGTVDAIELQNVNSGKHTTIVVDAVLSRIGIVPNTEMFRGQVASDAAGYIEVDANCATNLEGIFAVGDIANPISPTISTACGMAATAVKSIRILLVS